MPRRKRDFFDTTRDYWFIHKMMEEEEERQKSRENDDTSLFDDSDEFNEDADGNLDFDSDLDDDFLLGITDTPYAWREEYEDEAIEQNVDPKDYDDEDEFLEALEEAKTAWRNDYAVESIEYDVDPKDFESEEEFLEALEESQDSWREKYSALSSEYDLDPDDYDSEKEFAAALSERKAWYDKWQEKADEYGLWLDQYDSEEEFIEDYMVYWKDSLQDKADEYAMCIDDYESDDDFLEAYETIKAERTAMGAHEPCGIMELDAMDPKNYRDMDAYQAAYRLKEDEIYSYRELTDHERYIYQLMVEQPFPQGKYVDQYWGFRYNEAIADHLTLPAGIDKEDLADESTIIDVVDYLARVDEEFSFTAWKWCMETFWPYCKHSRDLINRVLYSWDSLNETFKKNLLDQLCVDSELKSAIFAEDHRENEAVIEGAPHVLYELLKIGREDIAAELYHSLRKNTLVREKEQFEIIENLIHNCCNYDELETVELFMATILPLTKDFPHEKLVWRKKEWMQIIHQYIDDMEEGSERYAFNRRNAWRARYRDEAEFFDMTIEHYDSEESFVEHLKEKRYFYEKQRHVASKEEAVVPVQKTAVAIKEDDNTVYHFVGIVFPHGGQVYSYLTNDESIKVGDEVIVPTARGEAKVKVVSTTACLCSTAPYDVDKAKHILRKADVE